MAMWIDGIEGAAAQCVLLELVRLKPWLGSQMPPPCGGRNDRSFLSVLHPRMQKSLTSILVHRLYSTGGAGHVGEYLGQTIRDFPSRGLWSSCVLSELFDVRDFLLDSSSAEILHLKDPYRRDGYSCDQLVMRGKRLEPGRRRAYVFRGATNKARKIWRQNLCLVGPTLPDQAEKKGKRWCGFMEGYDYPLVNIVTPVYNGARYLAECIESVIAQTYPRFEYVIVDNASTDNTREIARDYARRDKRIRLIECAEHLPIIQNWNRALGCISDDSKYVWVLPADDAMVGDSISRMMEVARKNPTVGIVASLRLRGNRIQCRGLDPARDVFNGREIVRLFMREEVFAFSPTGSLIRRDLIDAHQPFYPSRYLHADTAAFLNVLDQVNFGFVHDLLMFSREHSESVTSKVANRQGTQFRDGLLMLKEFGPRYFSPSELARVEARFLRRYYRFLVRCVVLFRERQLLSYHARALREVDCYPSATALASAVLGESRRAILRPVRAFRHVRARLQWGNNTYFRDDSRPT